jgi:hypothetical protein
VEGTFFRSFTVQFLSDEILLNAQKPAKKWRDLYLSNILSANTGLFNTSLTASKIYGVFHGTEDGQSININDNFIVDASGDVQLKGNITFGTNNFIKTVYHRGIGAEKTIPNIPGDNAVFPETDDSSWHTDMAQADLWASFSYNNG